MVFEYNRYSSPYQYVRKTVDLKVTDNTVEIYSGSTRIATPNRFLSDRKNQYSAHQEDMPDRLRISPWGDVRMNLGEVISRLEAQQAEPATLGLPFDDRMQRLVDYVYQEKYNAKIQRLIRSARLRFPQADMQGILYEGRGLNRELLGASTSTSTRVSSCRD